MRCIDNNLTDVVEAGIPIIRNAHLVCSNHYSNIASTHHVFYFRLHPSLFDFITPDMYIPLGIRMRWMDTMNDHYFNSQGHMI